MDGYKHMTGFGLAYVDPRGDHWVAYFVDDVEGPLVRFYAAGSEATSALANLIIKADEVGRPLLPRPKRKRGK